MTLRMTWMIALTWLLWALAPGALLALEPPPQAQIAADLDKVTDPREIVVIADSAGELSTLIALATPRGYRELDGQELETLGLAMGVLQIPEGRGGMQAIEELEGLRPGILAGLNHAFGSGDQAGIRGPRLYADRLMDWPAQGCAAHHSIGIIDAVQGPEVLGLPNTRYRNFARRGITDDPHGFLVARLLNDASRISGASLFAANVVGRTRLGGSEASADALVAAIGWLHSQGVRLINISLAGPYNKILDRAISRAAERGTLIVAAVGNDGASSPPRYPSAFSSVIAVTAVDANGARYRQSVAGQHVDIAAPGVDIFVAGKYVSGSSFAVPFVTGFIATLDRELPSANEARRILAEQARDLGAEGRDPVFGHGLLSLNQRCGS
ncbi:MAG: S8 family serine peptidase [Pseudomonadota bacterium]